MEEGGESCLAIQVISCVSKSWNPVLTVLPTYCRERRFTLSSISNIKSRLSLVLAQIFTTSSSRRVTKAPWVLRSKNLKLGFLVCSMTSLTYMGSSILSTCNENHVSAIFSAITDCRVCCLTLGAALVQLSVLLLLSLFPSGLLAFKLFSTPLPRSTILTVSSFKSPDDLECSSCLFSFWARAFAGVLSAFGSDSSSIVLFLGRRGGFESSILRREIPCRCLSLRF